MATQEKTWNVANRMHSQKDSDNPEVNHIIAGADEIYDDEKGVKQSDINAQVDSALGDRYTKEETYSKDQLDELITTPDVNYVSVVATNATTAVTDVLPATGEADTIYRVSNWNGTQYDPTMYALFAWNGTTYVCLAVRSFVGEVYDVSVNHPDGQGNPTPYADLTAALGTDGANIPADIRRGGMIIQFIQGTVQSSDNKYVEYFLTKNTWSASEADWEKVNLKEEVSQLGQEMYDYLAKDSIAVDNPTTGTANSVISKDGEISSNNSYYIVTPIKLEPNQRIILNKGNTVYCGMNVAVLFIADSSGAWQQTLLYKSAGTNVPLIEYENETDEDIYIGICTYTNQRSYIIQTLKEAATKESLYDYLKIDGSPLSDADARTVTSNIQAASLFNYGAASMSNADNPASSAAKVIAKDGFVLSTNTILIVRLYPSNTADNLTLNINNTGAKNLYYNGIRAGSDNCWKADEMAILTTDGLNYYLTSTTAVSRTFVRSIVGKIGHTENPDINRFLRELYLTGLNVSSDYYISQVSKTDGGVYSFTIREVGGNEVAVGRLAASQEKIAFVLVSQRNSSGIFGYAVVNWAVFDFGTTGLYATGCKFYKEIVTGLYFNPTISAYLKDAEVRGIIDAHVEKITSYLPSETTDYDNPTVLKASTKISYSGSESTHSDFCVVAPIRLEPGDTINLYKGQTFLVGADSSALFNSDAEGNWVSTIEGNSTQSTVNKKVSYKNTGVSAIYVGTCTRNAYKSYSITKKIDAASEKSVADVDARIDTLLSTGVSVPWQNVYNIASDIRTNRPYFLNDSYAAEVSDDDTSYLDDKIRNIPAGKHFIFTTDSHIDYYNVGLSQKDTQIMLYVKSKLNAGPVIFGGDAIGQQDSTYKAAKVLAVYAEDKFNAFGPEFLWCQGNHDANNNDGQNSISSVAIYERTTREMQRFGKAVFDNEGINIINNLEISSDDKAEAIAWMNLHYYYDDERNKVRFIVLESGDGSNGLGIVYSRHPWDGYTAFMGYATFVASALLNAPDGYDIVIIVHQLASESQFTSSAVINGFQDMGILYALLAAFKQHTSFVVKEDTSITESNAPVLYALMHTRIGSNGITYDFSNIVNKRAFVISGHFHFDDAWIVQNGTEHPEYTSRYKGKEYDSPWETIANDAILAIQVDRACLYDKGTWTNPDNPNHSKAPNSVSFANQDNSAEAGTDGERFGTVKEVLFDVVTITPDNKVVCTRIGAGSDREYNIPMVSA